MAKPTKKIRNFTVRFKEGQINFPTEVVEQLQTEVVEIVIGGSFAEFFLPSNLPLNEA